MSVLPPSNTPGDMMFSLGRIDATSILTLKEVQALRADFSTLDARVTSLENWRIESHAEDRTRTQMLVVAGGVGGLLITIALSVGDWIVGALF
jgi:hypothetical protein